MRTVDLIEKKRNGLALTKAEIDFLIGGYTTGEIPDYQMAAWAHGRVLPGHDPGGDRGAHPGHGAFRRHGGLERLRLLLGGQALHRRRGGQDHLNCGRPSWRPWAASWPRCPAGGLGHTGGTVDKLEIHPRLPDHPHP